MIFRRADGKFLGKEDARCILEIEAQTLKDEVIGWLDFLNSADLRRQRVAVHAISRASSELEKILRMRTVLTPVPHREKTDRHIQPRAQEAI